MNRIPALRPTVEMPTVDRKKPGDIHNFTGARRRTSKNSQFDDIMPESKAQRLHHKKARENWKWFDGISCDQCSKEIPPLRPWRSSHGNYCSEDCYWLAGGNMRSRFENHYGVKF